MIIVNLISYCYLLVVKNERIKVYVKRFFISDRVGDRVVVGDIREFMV